MHVFKPTITTTKADGTKAAREGAKWWIEFKDASEIRRRVAAFTDKAASEELGRKIMRLADFKRLGEKPDAGLSKFLEALPVKLRERLTAWGLLDSTRAAASKAIAEHLADFRDGLIAKGTTAKQAELVANRAGRVFKQAGCTFWSEVTPNKVQRAVSELCSEGNLSAQTFNFHLAACKQFARWLWREGRISESPLVHLTGRNVREDRRHDRRALEVSEVRALLAATCNAPTRFGMSGPQRAMLYRLALETGLRANELRSLTRASFTLEGKEPTVTIAAAYAKNRRQDLLPLRADTVCELRAFLASMLPTARVFSMPSSEHTAKMLRADLELAGIPYRDESGRVADFHALRHSFVSSLARSGVHPKTAQALARHCSVSLTLDRYTHSNREAEVDAINRLPSLTGAESAQAFATGTNGPETPLRLLGSPLGSKQRKQGDSVSRGDMKPAQELASVRQAAIPSNPIEMAAPQPTEPIESGGGGGIRTPGEPKPTAVFKTAAIDHSATPPRRGIVGAGAPAASRGAVGPARAAPAPAGLRAGPK